MRKGKAPPAPDYTGAALAQAQASTEKPKHPELRQPPDGEHAVGSGVMEDGGGD